MPSAFSLVAGFAPLALALEGVSAPALPLAPTFATGAGARAGARAGAGALAPVGVVAAAGEGAAILADCARARRGAAR